MSFLPPLTFHTLPVDRRRRHVRPGRPRLYPPVLRLRDLRATRGPSLARGALPDIDRHHDALPYRNPPLALRARIRILQSVRPRPARVAPRLRRRHHRDDVRARGHPEG